MNIIESLLGNQADGAVEQLGRQFGLDPSQTSSALGALLPAVAMILFTAQWNHGGSMVTVQNR